MRTDVMRTLCDCTPSRVDWAAAPAKALSNKASTSLSDTTPRWQGQVRGWSQKQQHRHMKMLSEKSCGKSYFPSKMSFKNSYAEQNMNEHKFTSVLMDIKCCLFFVVCLNSFLGDLRTITPTDQHDLPDLPCLAACHAKLVTWMQNCMHCTVCHTGIGGPRLQPPTSDSLTSQT